MKMIVILLLAFIGLSCAEIGIEPPDGYYISGPQIIQLNGSNFTGYSEHYFVIYPYINSSGNQAFNVVSDYFVAHYNQPVAKERILEMLDYFPPLFRSTETLNGLKYPLGIDPQNGTAVMLININKTTNMQIKFSRVSDIDEWKPYIHTK